MDNDEPFNVLCWARFGRMLTNRYDYVIGGSVRCYGEYSWGELELFERLLHLGDVVVEAGANIGTHTVPLTRIVGTNGEILALEPQRLVFYLLCANLALNQCVNVRAEQAALAACGGEINVPWVNPRATENFGAVALGSGITSGENVRTLALDDLALPRCDFIKADVEGMEAEVLRGANVTIQQYRPTIYVENNRRDRSPELIELLFSMNYRLWWHKVPMFNPSNMNGEKTNYYGEVASYNMLCVPQEKSVPVSGLVEVTDPSDWWHDWTG